MESIGCRDLGIPCSFIAVGRRPEQVKKLMFDHALRRHKDLLNKAGTSKGEMIDRIDSLLS